MNVKNYVSIFIALLVFVVTKGQQALLCDSYYSYIKIENTTDIPSVTTNPDHSLRLVFAEPYITDLFSNYTVHDFYQTSPNSPSEDILKYYTLSHNSKALVEDIFTLLDIACFSNEDGFGNITVSPNPEFEIVGFLKPNGVFGEYIIEVTKRNLSLEDNNLNCITPFQTKGHPYTSI